MRSLVGSLLDGVLADRPLKKQLKFQNCLEELSTLSWRGRKTGKIGIHLTENGSNQHHVISDGH